MDSEREEAGRGECETETLADGWNGSSSRYAVGTSPSRPKPTRILVHPPSETHVSILKVLLKRLSLNRVAAKET